MSTLASSAFRRIFAAASVSNLGDGVYFVALPLLGTTVTDDPRLIAGLATVGMLPSLLLALPAGGLIDRVNRARLMVHVDMIRALLVGMLVVSIAANRVELWHLYVVAFGLGIGELLFDTASSAVLPDIVDDQDLPRANARLSTVAEIGNGIAGPAVGGLLFAALASLPFLINSVSFLIASLLVRPIVRRHVPLRHTSKRPQELVNDRTNFYDDIRTGLMWLFHHRELRSLALVVAGWNLFGWIPEGTFVLYAEQELGVGPTGFGLLFGASSVGAVIGGLLTGRLVDRIGIGGVMQLTLVSYALLMAPPFFLSSPALVGIILLAQGFLLISWSVMSVTYRQTNVPHDMLGRIGSVFFLLGVGLAPVGLMIGGLLASWLGLRSVFLVSAACLGVLYLISARRLSRLSHRSAMEAE